MTLPLLIRRFWLDVVDGGRCDHAHMTLAVIGLAQPHPACFWWMAW